MVEKGWRSHKTDIDVGTEKINVYVLFPSAVITYYDRHMTTLFSDASMARQDACDGSQLCLHDPQSFR